MNINHHFFMIFIQPHADLVSSCFDRDERQHQKTIEKFLRTDYKRFCLLPRGFETTTLYRISGDLKKILEFSSKVSEMRLWGKMYGNLDRDKYLISRLRE